MNYPTHDTDWSTSTQGNEWKRVNGKVLIAGRKKTGEYWAFVDDKFMEDTFKTLAEATSAAENEFQRQDGPRWY